MPERKLSLGAFFHPTGHHVAAWRHPASQIDAGTNIDHYIDLAQRAEVAHFDFVFLADALAVRHGNLAALSRWPQYMAYFEPTTLIAAMSTVTSRIGFVATATTSYNEPYNIARRYASLDHISKGRVGWNVVTSSNQDEARNFSRSAHFDHSERYRRATEFIEIVKGLWDSWEDDAFVRDRESGLYFDPAKLHRLDHSGQDFQVRGPLNVARPPQGHPVIVQAGSSDTGRDFAAAFAEVIFTSQTNLDEAVAFRSDLHERAARIGRSPSEIRIMPGLNPIVGDTLEEAHEKRDYLQSLISPELGLALLAPILPEVDLTACDVDRPIPMSLLRETTNASKSDLKRLVEQTEAGMTIRQIYMQYAGARGQNTVIGTAQDVADHMIRWADAGAVDGFLIQPAHLPVGLSEFANRVVPLLQERGYFRSEYEGSTLREHLGLPRPANRYASRGIRNTSDTI